MNFPDSFIENINKWNAENPKQKLSETQLYKQAGNSVVVACFEKIIRQLKFQIK